MSYLRVVLDPEGFYPRGLRWRGRAIRVLYVEETFTCGLERRHRLRTPEGTYEVGLHSGTGLWQMRRTPAWHQRLWMRIQDMPRYPAPIRRRRGHRETEVRRAAAVEVGRPQMARAISVGRL